jgi:hypothetical protein
MRHLALICLLAMSSTAYSAQLISKRGESSDPYAPVNEKRGGTVKYNSTGIGRDGRRKSAYKEMYNYCSGPYKIVSEDMRKESHGTVMNYPMMMTMNQDWTYFDFECVSEAAAAAPAESETK